MGWVVAELRDYQQEVVSKIQQEVRAGARSVLLVAPTGSGKTRMVSEAMRRLRGGCMAVAHRREIVKQIEREFAETGPEDFISVGIGSRQVGGLVREQRYKFMFIDEAHHAAAASYKRLIENRGNMILVGATATPYRADGAALMPMFDSVVTAPSASQLCEAGYLAPVSYVASDAVDYNGIRMAKKGEFEEVDALARVRVAVQAGDLVSAWRKYASGRNALIYGINLEHCEQICRELADANVPAGMVSSRCGKKERERTLKLFESRRIRAVVNCEVFTEGTDIRGVGAIIMLRPTASRALYKQMIGRGMRPDGDCVVIDHVGNFLRHGNVLAESPVEIMESARLVSASSGDSVRGMDVNAERMELHVEKVQVELAQIWAPSVFSA